MATNHLYITCVLLPSKYLPLRNCGTSEAPPHWLSRDMYSTTTPCAPTNNVPAVLALLLVTNGSVGSAGGLVSSAAPMRPSMSSCVFFVRLTSGDCILKTDPITGPAGRNGPISDGDKTCWVRPNDGRRGAGLCQRTDGSPTGPLRGCTHGHWAPAMRPKERGVHLLGGLGTLTGNAVLVALPATAIHPSPCHRRAAPAPRLSGPRTCVTQAMHGVPAVVQVITGAPAAGTWRAITRMRLAARCTPSRRASAVLSATGVIPAPFTST